MDIDANPNQESPNPLQLTNAQKRGMEEFGLSVHQVFTHNFGKHTVKGIEELYIFGSANSPQEAFNQLKHLDEAQVHGITSLRLSRQQVQAKKFGWHTINAIQRLINRLIAFNRSHAFSIVSGLNKTQITAMLQTRNFGRHTVKGMQHLKEQNSELGNLQAFQKVKELTQTQIKGMVYHDLTRDQVQTLRFGEDIMNGMDDLIGKRGLTDQQAFELIKELDFYQIAGVVDYNLTREQVKNNNFGKHTLEGMDHLLMQDARLSFNEAYNRMIGFTALQIKGIVTFNLNQAQVQHPLFHQNTFAVMEALKSQNPTTQNNHLFQTAISMPEHQARALVKHKLKIEQAGITINDQSQFVAIPESNEAYQQILSGPQIDAFDFLTAQQQIPREEALQKATQLNSTQVIGLVDFGLTLAQVETPFFKENPKILEELGEAIKSNNEVNIPLSESEQETINITGTEMRKKASDIFETLASAQHQTSDLRKLTQPLQQQHQDMAGKDEEGKQPPKNTAKRANRAKQKNKQDKRPRI